MQKGLTLTLFSAIYCLILAACSSQQPVEHYDLEKDGFIQVVNGRFQKNSKPYAFVGMNVWYGAYIGAADPAIGDRPRLLRELDFLKENGITHIRVLAASENSPLLHSLKPAFLNQDQSVNGTLLEGMDFLLAELAKRDMHAVLYLNNFWEWSGGMATYLSWVNGGKIVDPAAIDHVWPAFAVFSSSFYKNEEANKLYQDYIQKLITRKNSITGLLYSEDPTIMSWQLANEPRAGDGLAKIDLDLSAYYRWVDKTATLIDALAPKQLISTGSEGTVGCVNDESCFIQAHKVEEIDFLTFHMWPYNWAWIDVANMEETIGVGLDRTEDYINTHIKLAKILRKPIIVEEFGFPRDGGAFAPETTTNYRNRYLSLVYGAIETSLEEGGPLMGSNFWSWGGEGRAQHENARWQTGDISYMGDPPQETQGLNSVFDTDTETLELIRQHSDRVNMLSN